MRQGSSNTLKLADREQFRMMSNEMGVKRSGEQRTQTPAGFTNFLLVAFQANWQLWLALQYDRAVGTLNIHTVSPTDVSFSLTHPQSGRDTRRTEPAQSVSSVHFCPAEAPVELHGDSDICPVDTGGSDAVTHDI